MHGFQKYFSTKMNLSLLPFPQTFFKCPCMWKQRDREEKNKGLQKCTQQVCSLDRDGPHTHSLVLQGSLQASRKVNMLVNYLNVSLSIQLPGAM